LNSLCRNSLAVKLKIICFLIQSYHDSMARPQLSDTRDGPQVWRVAANMLITNRGRHANGHLLVWGFDRRLTVPHCKVTSTLPNATQRALDLDRLFLLLV
jgi:hypothetical protein